MLMDVSDQRRTTRVNGRFERMGPNECSNAERVAVKRGGSFNVKSSRCNLRLMKDGTQKASFLIIAVGRVGRLVLQLRAAGKRAGRTMMMDSAGKHVYQEVSGQRGERNQRTAHDKLHLNITRWSVLRAKFLLTAGITKSYPV
jgi:hypothetical protein